MPPPESMTLSGARTPTSASLPCRPVTYRRISGITYALAAAVQVRSYSRISGATAVERVTGTEGQVSARISPARRSCAALT